MFYGCIWPNLFIMFYRNIWLGVLCLCYVFQIHLVWSMFLLCFSGTFVRMYDVFLFVLQVHLVGCTMFVLCFFRYIWQNVLCFCYISQVHLVGYTMFMLCFTGIFGRVYYGFVVLQVHFVGCTMFVVCFTGTFGRVYYADMWKKDHMSKKPVMLHHVSSDTYHGNLLFKHK